ncbi:MAG: response regulator [Deltaproteobacteria bacterium]|nr:response regulator [Deltaproteobacteria bacterium]
MATNIEALRDKFRGICSERIREVRKALDKGASTGSPELRDALSELHTIKGESAVVGFSVISQLAHALEDLLISGARAGAVPVADLSQALSILDEALRQPSRELSDDVELSDLLAEVRAASSSGPRAAPAPASPEALPKSVPATPHASTLRWTRVDAARIDALCERITEASLKMSRVWAQLGEAASHAPTRELARELALIVQQSELARVDLDEVTAAAWALRLEPVAPALEDLVAHARSLAESAGKQVEIEVSASGVELERNLLDGLREPLMHILRNAIDHGVEAPEDRAGKAPLSRVRCTAEAQGASVIVCVEDDGAGLDLEMIRKRAVALGLLAEERAPLLSPADTMDLVFLAGFTQRDAADSISGRGMGLSAARRKVEGLGGSVRVESIPGRGTRFELAVPSSVSKERVLLLETCGALYGVPTRWVRSVVRDSDSIAFARRTGVHRHQAEAWPVRLLSDWLGLEEPSTGGLLLMEVGDRRGAVIVGKVVGECDLLRRPADRLLSAGGRIVASGAAADGSVVLLLRWADVLRASVRRQSAVQTRDAAAQLPRILVVDDSDVVRDIVADILVNAGLAVETASNGAAALERLERPGIDLVISDVEMPRMTGFELLERIRQRTEALPVIMLTTRSSPEDRRKAAGLGANAYVVKSEFQGSTLLEVVGRFVELRS